MITTGQNEELQRLQGIIEDMKSSNDVELKMIYPAIEKKSDSNKVLVFGGSFNPFQKAHKELILKALEKTGAREAIVFMTLKHSQNKPLEGMTHAQRVYSLGLEQQNLPFISVGLINDGFFRNWFHRLREFHPEENLEYIYLMGADLMPQIIEGNKPEDYPKIFSTKMLVANRKNKWNDFDLPIELSPFLKNILALDVGDEMENISTTQVREAIKKGEDVGDLVSEEIKKYIGENNLYRK